MRKPVKTKKSVKPKKTVKAKKRVKKTVASYYAQSKRLGFRLIEAADEALYSGLFMDAKTVQHFISPLTPERAKQSFDRVLLSSHEKTWIQRVTILEERGSKKPIGIASIKMIDTVNRIAEVGILLKPSAHAQRFATEASIALLNSAFRRYTIDGITATVAAGHKVGERLVKTLGYSRGDDLTPSGERGARTEWTMSREKWADTFK